MPNSIRGVIGNGVKREYLVNLITIYLVLAVQSISLRITFRLFFGRVFAVGQFKLSAPVF